MLSRSSSGRTKSFVTKRDILRSGDFPSLIKWIAALHLASMSMLSGECHHSEVEGPFPASIAMVGSSKGKLGVSVPGLGQSARGNIVFLRA